MLVIRDFQSQTAERFKEYLLAPSTLGNFCSSVHHSHLGMLCSAEVVKNLIITNNAAKKKDPKAKYVFNSSLWCGTTHCF